MRKDEENERAVRAYSKAGTYDYVPRSRKEDDYVVARPMKVPKCVVCGKTEPEPFECEYCHEYYCEEHLPREKHNCRGESKEEADSWEEAASMKRAIVAKMENMIGRMPAVYMLIDTADPEELKGFLECLEEMEGILNGIADREGRRIEL